MINKCVNFELINSFNLSAFSTIEYCVIQQDLRPLGENPSSYSEKRNNQRIYFRQDSLEIFASLVVVVILTLVALSSVYDRHLRNLSFNGPDHYKTLLKMRSQRILTIFSIRRNWKILSAPTKSDVRELRFIDALRTLIMFGVIHNHCSMFSIIVPSENPMFIDEVRTNIIRR